LRIGFQLNVPKSSTALTHIASGEIFFELASCRSVLKAFFMRGSFYARQSGFYAGQSGKRPLTPSPLGAGANESETFQASRRNCRR
jgi:hypothetical protein